MKNKTLILAIMLSLAAWPLCAQEKAFRVNYTPERIQLAEDTFRKLVAACTGSNALNLQSDFIDSMELIRDHPELRTAILENYIFDYCNVDDSFKTEENILAQKFEGKSYYTLRERPEWNEIGKQYEEKRKTIEENFI